MNSLAYMHAAYAIVWTALSGYAVYLAVRYRKLLRENEDLKK